MPCENGKIPAVDFPNRGTLTGTERIFTQDPSFVPAEQHFTLNQAALFTAKQLLDNISRETITVQNDGQKDFTLQKTANYPQLSRATYVNANWVYGLHYVITGNTLSFIVNGGYQLVTGEQIEIIYI